MSRKQDKGGEHVAFRLCLLVGIIYDDYRGVHMDWGSIYAH